jgi:uncharacterized protein with HEPN domain
MPSKSPVGPLSDIKRNIELTRLFIGDVSFQEFREDTRTVYAVLCSLEIITEASRRLPDDLKARHPDIPWVDMARAGNFYRHYYERIIDQFIWDTVQHSLGSLLTVVEQELRQLGEGL